MAHPRLDRHLAAVVGCDVADDRQAEAGSTSTPTTGPVDAVEALENPFQVLGRDADAPVTDADLHAVVDQAGPLSPTNRHRST